LKFNVNILFSHLFSTSLENGLIRLVQDVQNLVRAVSILTQNHPKQEVLCQS
jgi:hypothetical protein